jgi:hypothetical protein
MRFLGLVRRKIEAFPEEEFNRLLEPEAESVRALYTEGVVRSVSSRGDVKGAVLELECADIEEAKQKLNTLPFAAHGMVEVQIIPLLPYRGFAPRGQ